MASHKRKGLYFSIGFKLIFIISIIISSSLGGMIWLATYYFKDDNVKRAEQNTLDRVSLISLKVRSDFRSIIESSQLMLKSAEATKNKEKVTFRDNDLLYIGKIIKNGENTYKEAFALPNIDTLTKMNISEVPIQEIISAEDEQIMSAFATEIKVFNASLYFNEPVIGITTPYIVIGPGEAKSTMMIFISMNRFLEAVKSQSIYKSYVVNGSGELIAHYDSKLVKAKANFIKVPIVQKMLKSTVENGKYEFSDEKGRLFLGSFQKTGFSDIGVVTTVEQSVAFAAVYRLQKRNILITIIVINLAILILFIFSKTISRPIQRLAKAADKIKEGDFEVTVKPTTRDEIGDLSESFTEMAQGLAEREKLKGAFGKFVNEEIAEQVLKGEIKLGGERKYAAVFFSDIRSFTAISEKMEPEQVVEFLNQYMTRMVECVKQTKGTVDKYIGDAIMALWGAPISHGNDTENAINGALLMRESLMEFNASRSGSDIEPIIKIGCGINVGPLVAGQIGSDEKMEYTVIGDTVNLASRIEALNKPFGTDILISEAAYEKTKGTFRVEPMQKIKVKGKIEAQQIYAVLSRVDDAAGYKSLQEVRDALGIDMKGKPSENVEEKEVKYEILDEKEQKPEKSANVASNTQQSETIEIVKTKKDVKYEVLD